MPRYLLRITNLNSTRSGFLEDQDMLRLTDKQGNPIFCYKCKCSTLSGAPISRCDYCSLSWHLDCLSPPLPTVKTVGTKWKCPNHADHVYRKSRRPKNARIVDTNLRRGYKNDGNVEILDSSDEEQLEINTRDIPIWNFQDTSSESRAPTPHYEQLDTDGVVIRVPSEGVKLDFIQSINTMKAEAYSDTHNSQILLALDELATKSQNFREGVRNLCYLKFDGTPDVMVANSRTNIEMLLDSALCLQSPLQPKGSKLKAQIESKEIMSPSNPPKGNGLQSSTTPRKPAHQAAQAVLACNLRKSSLANTVKSKSIASQTSTPKAPQDSLYEGIESVSAIIGGISLGTDEINPDERKHLFAVKRLMELKGKDALMEFLAPKGN